MVVGVQMLLPNTCSVAASGLPSSSVAFPSAPSFSLFVSSWSSYSSSSSLDGDVQLPAAPSFNVKDGYGPKMPALHGWGKRPSSSYGGGISSFPPFSLSYPGPVASGIIEGENRNYESGWGPPPCTCPAAAIPARCRCYQTPAKYPGHGGGPHHHHGLHYRPRKQADHHHVHHGRRGLRSIAGFIETSSSPSSSSASSTTPRFAALALLSTCYRNRSPPFSVRRADVSAEINGDVSISGDAGYGGKEVRVGGDVWRRGGGRQRRSGRRRTSCVDGGVSSQMSGGQDLAGRFPAISGAVYCCRPCYPSSSPFRFAPGDFHGDGAERKRMRGAVVMRAGRGDDGNDEAKKAEGGEDNAPETLFMRELRRRGISTTKSSSSSRSDASEEEQAEAAGQTRTAREGIPPPPPPPPTGLGADQFQGQTERSRALNSEGLDGLPPRAVELVKLGGSFFLAFTPLIAATFAAFFAIYLVPAH